MRYLGVWIVLAALISDQLSKLILLYGVQLTTNAPLTITPFLDFILVWNRGVSFGLFSNDALWGRIFLIGFSLVVIGFLFNMLRYESRVLPITALGFIIGGAIGNLIDRFVHGAVVDFISLHAQGYYWYVFNIADIWISLGAGLLIISWFIDYRQTQKPEA